ncbi:hypothetical protein [Virgibacillus sp. 7505]|nr:hypothetical protein [Virgibacillus sp. 7505]
MGKLLLSNGHAFAELLYDFGVRRWWNLEDHEKSNKLFVAAIRSFLY